MLRTRLVVKAPSNIALVKYMGKEDAEKNLPANPSLSMTLQGLCTYVDLVALSALSNGTRSGLEVCWVPEEPVDVPLDRPLLVPQLNEKEQGRLIGHVQRVWSARNELWNLLDLHTPRSSRFFDVKKFEFRTANTFPHASGIASSASSFAALTFAAVVALAGDREVFLRAWQQSAVLKQWTAQLARQGSGSSCRSFLGPWVKWDQDQVVAIQAHEVFPRMSHFVLVVENSVKKISSSEAHARVKTSPLWQGRVERARERIAQMEHALQAGQVSVLARVAWAEAWEMHSLFHTSLPPFSYWVPGTLEALQWLAPFLEQEHPPIVTLDAGPNLHILVECSHKALWQARFQQRFAAIALLEDEQGEGVSLL